jgi:hypothetical protein
MKIKKQLELFKNDLPVNKDLAQHNYLIFANYRMDVIESRIFISMLARLNRDDKDFDWIHIPVTEIISNLSGDSYKTIKEACDKLTGFKVNTQLLSKNKFDFIVLVLRCAHEKGSGYIHAKFSSEAKDYLLQLSGNFTTTELFQIMQLRNPHAIRIYWVIKSLYNTNTITLELLALKALLFGKEASTKHDHYGMFKKRVLYVVQAELDQTDCQFDFEEIKASKSKTVIAIKFIRRAQPIKIEHTIPEHPIFERLSKLGISIKSLPNIKSKLDEGAIDFSYIEYVIQYKIDELRKGKIKKLAGAIYKAIIDLHLVNEYKASKTKIVHPILNLPLAANASEYNIISNSKALAMYKEEKAAGTTKYPFAGYIKGLKAGRNIIVEGFQY